VYDPAKWGLVGRASSSKRACITHRSTRVCLHGKHRTKPMCHTPAYLSLSNGCRSSPLERQTLQLISAQFLHSKLGRWRIQKRWKAGRGRQFISPRSHLSQIHTTIYMLFTRKNAFFERKKYEPMGKGRHWTGRGNFAWHQCPELTHQLHVMQRHSAVL